MNALQVLELFADGVNAHLLGRKLKCQVVPGYVIDGWAQHHLKIGDYELVKIVLHPDGLPARIRFSTGRRVSADSLDNLTEILRVAIREDLALVLSGFRTIDKGVG